MGFAEAALLRRSSLSLLSHLATAVLASGVLAARGAGRKFAIHLGYVWRRQDALIVLRGRVT